MSKKIILLILVVLIIVGAIVGTMMWNKPHRNVKDEIAIKTSAIELYNAFLKDSVAARAKFVNNIIDITGEVAKEIVNQQNQHVVFLKTEVADGYINCTMEGNSGGIKTGETISLKGICNGYNGGEADLGIPGDVVVVRCYPENK